MYTKIEGPVGRPLLAAHRGVCGANIPCNTLTAFDIAVRQGADIVELDVTKSSDGELFIFHPGMERIQLYFPDRLQRNTAARIRELRYVNCDCSPTELGLATLDEALELLKGRCVVNIDKFWMNPQEIAACVRRHGMQDSVLVKTNATEEDFDNVERYAPDLPFMPMVFEKDAFSERLVRRNMRYVGVEALFSTEQSELCSPAYLERMHRQGLMVWSNAIVYDYRSVLSAGHNDDISIAGREDEGWGWLIDRGFDMIQTDWLMALRQYMAAREARA